MTFLTQKDIPIGLVFQSLLTLELVLNVNFGVCLQLLLKTDTLGLMKALENLQTAISN